MLNSYLRDDVFVAGGQPSVTYVQREELHVERQLARAIASPNQIASLSGPTKTGKTVLCRRVLGEREYVWVDCGLVKSVEEFWSSVCRELNIPNEEEDAEESETAGEIGIDAVITASGSRLHRRSHVAKRINGATDAIRYMLENKIILTVDDFHYLNNEDRMVLMRNLKGAVFNGLKVLLLSVTHRAFEAIRAESELTGRFTAVTLPEWSDEDLKQIPVLGFKALRVDYDSGLLDTLARESQESPFLMQKFCWEICFDCEIERAASLMSRHRIPSEYNVEEMLVRLARDAGLPIYQRLVAGPQSRKSRTKRPLKSGGEADIYEATLLAIAETGPKSAVSYEELRQSLNIVLADMVPQKHEITSALKHLREISKKAGTEVAIDWDEDKREVSVADPYLRFYLRWQVRSRKPH